MKERKPNRLPEYDYSLDNLYFVTMCVHNWYCCFGSISVAEHDINDNHDNDVGTGRDLRKNGVRNQLLVIDS